MYLKCKVLSNTDRVCVYIPIFVMHTMFYNSSKDV